MNVVHISPSANPSDRTQTPPPLPLPERQRLRTETSATDGWAARLAARFPASTVEPRRLGPKN